MSDNQLEPFPTNPSAVQTRLVPDQRDLESNTDTGIINRNDHRNQAEEDSRERTITALRRRYRRRDALYKEPDLEEGKISYLPPVISEDQGTTGYGALSTRHTLETTVSSEAVVSTSQRNLHLPIMHRSNFNRKSDDKFREKFKNLIRSSAEGASESPLLDKMQTKTEDAVCIATRSNQDAVGVATRSKRNDPMPIVHQSSYIRKPDEKLREKYRNLIRSPADGIPEVHIIGELSEGTGFKDTYVSCKWYLEWGKAWSFLAGDDAGQTQYSASDDRVHIWNHPIDVHFATASMQGWPRLIMQLWELDEYGRSILSGYGFTHFPTNPGYHELEIRCWRASGSITDELNSFFLGTSASLADEKIIFGKAWEARSQLNTVSSGTGSARQLAVYAALSVIFN